MDFSDSAAEAEFRAKARNWLASNAQLKKTPKDIYAAGLCEAERLQLSRDFQKKKASAGFAGITLAKEFGGGGGTPIEDVIYRQEESRYLAPFGFFEIGLGMCIPTLLAYATTADKKRFAPPALRGEEIWCQLFSEPSAGSDLAGIRTRAVQQGDDWVINGQKVWISGAQFSDFGIVLVRTHPGRPKHKGLTMFYIDMKSVGVEVRPIRQMSGESDFNEVFFTDVVVPDNQRLGEPGQGWAVALTTLMHERLSVGADTGLITYEDLLVLGRRTIRDGISALEDPYMRNCLADWYIRGEGLRFLNYRAITSLSRGQTPGPEQSIVKLVGAKMAQELADYSMDVLGEEALLTSEDIGDDWQPIERSWYWGAAMRIAGGTDEILRNVIAERVLGLPGDIRVDKDMPFNELP